MCLAIPGLVESVLPDPRHALFLEGVVRFGAVRKTVSLAYVPDVAPGEYVIVHAGFAIARLDEAEARRVLELLAEAGALADELGSEVASGSEIASP